MFFYCIQMPLPNVLDLIDISLVIISSFLVLILLASNVGKQLFNQGHRVFTGIAAGTTLYKHYIDNNDNNDKADDNKDKDKDKDKSKDKDKNKNNNNNNNNNNKIIIIIKIMIKM
jgi:hypothetical protein